MAIQDVLSENKHRRYPFVEDSNTGGLPDWVLLDIRLVDTDYSGETASLLCIKAAVVGDEIVLTFAYTKGDCETSFDISCKVGSDISVRTKTLNSGCVVKYAMYGGGSEYTLDHDFNETSLEAAVIRSRLVLLDRRLFVKTIGGCSGRVHVVDGHNTEAKIVDGAITVTAGNGLGLGADCEQPEDAFDCIKALLFINGQHADTQGNININGGAGVTVQTGKMAYVNGSLVPAITIKADPQIKELY